MQRRDHLGEFRCRNAASDDCANRPTHCGNTCELREHLYRETYSSQGSEDARADAEDPKCITLTCCGL